MKRTIFVVILFCFLVICYTLLLAQDETVLNPEKPKTPNFQVNRKILEKYDLNKNGLLDPEEEDLFKKDREKERKRILEKYDRNKDGMLDDTEKELMKADLKAQKAKPEIKQEDIKQISPSAVGN